MTFIELTVKAYHQKHTSYPESVIVSPCAAPILTERGEVITDANCNGIPVEIREFDECHAAGKGSAKKPRYVGIFYQEGSGADASLRALDLAHPGYPPPRGTESIRGRVQGGSPSASTERGESPVLSEDTRISGSRQQTQTSHPQP